VLLAQAMESIALGMSCLGAIMLPDPRWLVVFPTTTTCLLCHLHGMGSTQLHYLVASHRESPLHVALSGKPFHPPSFPHGPQGHMTVPGLQLPLLRKSTLGTSATPAHLHWCSQLRGT
jgi:hypothetical protein